MKPQNPTEKIKSEIEKEEEWWNNPKNKILNILTLGAHGLRHVGLL